MQDSRRDILEHLREQGESTVAELARATGLAAVTVRHHLQRLRQRGLLELRAERAGRGRPRHVYRLSRAGAGQLCPDRYESLACRLLDRFKQDRAADAEAIFARMAEGLLEDHRGALEAEPEAAARLAMIVELLEAEGFVLRLEQGPDGFRIEEVACPYAELSERHPEVCCLDRTLIEAARVGELRRERWRPDGDEACLFHILPTGPSL